MSGRPNPVIFNLSLTANVAQQLPDNPLDCSFIYFSVDFSTPIYIGLSPDVTIPGTNLSTDGINIQDFSVIAANTNQFYAISGSDIQLQVSGSPLFTVQPAG